MNTKTPLISVVIPCYNAERFVEQAVRSIMNQTYSNLEIICINDGSSDNTGRILYALQEEDSRIVVVENETNLKLIATLNKGVSMAKGEYIARMDADDISHPTRIKTQIDFLEKNTVDVCGTMVNYITYEGKYHSPFPTICTCPLSIVFVSMFDSPLMHSTVIGKTSIFKQFPYPSGDNVYVIEDYALWCKMIMHNIKMEVIPQRLLSYRRNFTGESVSRREIQRENKVRCARQQQENLLKHSLPKEILSCIQLDSEADVSKFIISQSLKDLDEIMTMFVKHYSPSKYEEREIKNWIIQRKLHILACFFACGPSAIKASIMGICIINIRLFCSRTAIRNIWYGVLRIVGCMKK